MAIESQDMNSHIEIHIVYLSPLRRSSFSLTGKHQIRQRNKDND